MCRSTIGGNSASFGLRLAAIASPTSGRPRRIERWRSGGLDGAALLLIAQGGHLDTWGRAIAYLLSCFTRQKVGIWSRSRRPFQATSRPSYARAQKASAKSLLAFSFWPNTGIVRTGPTAHLPYNQVSSIACAGLQYRSPRVAGLRRSCHQQKRQ